MGLGLVKIINSCAKGGRVVFGLGAALGAGEGIINGMTEDIVISTYLMGILFCGSAFVKNLAEAGIRDYQRKEMTQFHTLPYNID